MFGLFKGYYPGKEKPFDVKLSYTSRILRKNKNSLLFSEALLQHLINFSVLSHVVLQVH
jgi:hypothetical protein